MSNIIIMAFSPRNIIGCFLKKGLQRGVTGTPGPPLATPLVSFEYTYQAIRKVMVSLPLTPWFTYSVVTTFPTSSFSLLLDHIPQVYHC